MSISADNLPVSIRFLVVLIAAAGVGWGLSATVNWLTRKFTDLRRFLCCFLPLVFAAVLAWWVEWLAVDHPQDTPELKLLSVIGLCTALWVAARGFQITARRASPHAFEQRCIALLMFSATSAAILTFAAVGQST
ncbi:hypothetical protein [Leisingera sp. S232]|uniref:hypothetical protein n=1 Tax=Leisingera sp. S232 TaxID=3415132 RepID=UPI003C7B2957